MRNRFCHRNASTVLTCLGGVGLVATAVLTVKAKLKALQLIEEGKQEKGEELSKWEVVKVAAPKYIPAVLTGTATLICIFGANALSKKQQASLISAYALLDESYKKYRNKNIELNGKEARDEVVKAIAIEEAKEVGITAGCLCTNTCLTSDEACGDPVLFYDEWSHRYFESTIEQVIAAQYHINRNFVLRGYVTLNEFYEFLGLEQTDYGNAVGWAVDDSFYWLDFDNHKVLIDDDIECYIIETPWDPSPEFLEYYY